MKLRYLRWPVALVAAFSTLCAASAASAETVTIKSGSTPVQVTRNTTTVTAFTVNKNSAWQVEFDGARWISSASNAFGPPGAFVYRANLGIPSDAVNISPVTIKRAADN